MTKYSETLFVQEVRHKIDGCIVYHLLNETSVSESKGGYYCDWIHLRSDTIISKRFNWFILCLNAHYPSAYSRSMRKNLTTKFIKHKNPRTLEPPVLSPINNCRKFDQRNHNSEGDTMRTDWHIHLRIHRS